jgi:hypothetical protein
MDAATPGSIEEDTMKAIAQGFLSAILVTGMAFLVFGAAFPIGVFKDVFVGVWIWASIEGSP